MTHCVQNPTAHSSQLTADGRKESEFLFKKMSLKDICFAFVGPCWDQSPNSKQS